MNKQEYDRRKDMVLFISQIVISVSIIIICLLNISLNADHPIWFILLGSALGFLIPGPSFNVKSISKGGLSVDDTDTSGIEKKNESLDKKNTSSTSLTSKVFEDKIDV